MLKRTFVRGLACGVFGPAALPLMAAGFPDKPIKLVTPFPPGGTVGNIAFAVSTRMGAILGQPVVLDAKPGAAGTIAASVVVRAPKDGYTLLFATSSMLGIAKYIYQELPYDPVADFAPVGIVGNVTVGIFASQKSGIESLDDMLARAKAKPGDINFGSPGVGSVSHLAAELFMVRSKLNIVHVPYAAAAPQFTDLVGGQTQLAFGGVSSGMPYTRDGRIKLIAVAAKSRVKSLPQIPALGELFPGYDAPAWLGIVAPKGTPQDVLDRLEAAFQEALADKEVRAILDGQGLEADPMNARAFGDKIRREMALWEEAVKASGMKPSVAR